MLELGDDVSVELLGLQPVNANTARTVLAASGIIRFISVFSFFIDSVFFAISVMTKAFQRSMSSIRLWLDVVLCYGVFVPGEI